MGSLSFALSGTHVRLEPLEPSHTEGLALASASDPRLYQWSAVPRGEEQIAAYIRAATVFRDIGTAVPFAIVASGVIVGSTRFFKLEQWPWAKGHERHGRTDPDVCEIGYTWLASSAIRTGVNTEAKLLMLTHAFETWKVLRISFHTDVRNLRSRAAIERIGGKFEGILRSHRMATDNTARDSARFSILAAEWPDVKERLIQLRDRPRPAQPQ